MNISMSLWRSGTVVRFQQASFPLCAEDLSKPSRLRNTRHKKLRVAKSDNCVQNEIKKQEKININELSGNQLSP